MTLPLLHAINYRYFPKLMTWKGYTLEHANGMFKADGFLEYNLLVDVNKIFSSNPYGIPIDRTGLVSGPLNFYVPRPWRCPNAAEISLDQVFESRVQEYLSRDCKLNIFWSGGMDSTAIVVAFLLHTKNLDQLRIVYTPFSTYENREFLEYLQRKFPQLEMIDISGDVYLNTELDGIAINGHGGDEFTASLDDSFFDEVGPQQLVGSWKDYFFQLTKNPMLIELCEQHFALSGRPIDTLLEARWWYYASTKNYVYDAEELNFFIGYNDFGIEKASSFFNCWQFEQYMWAHTDQILEDPTDYKTYKKFLRYYIHQLYANPDYLEHGIKINSRQVSFYKNKKNVLLDQHWICILNDASVVRTDNLPLFSKKEFNHKYGNTLDYLFNPIPRTVA